MRLFLMIISICLLSGYVRSQTPKDPPPPYLKTRLIPKFTIAKVPDSTRFTDQNLEKGKKTIVIFFGPECGHCTAFAKKMMDSVNLFKNTQIVMVSSFDFGKIRKFYDDNKLQTADFITCGKDENFFFISHYGIRSFPSAYVYNEKGKFVKKFESEIEIKDLTRVR